MGGLERNARSRALLRASPAIALRSNFVPRCAGPAVVGDCLLRFPVLGWGGRTLGEAKRGSPVSMDSRA